ncbi:MAG TPA: hypothetical protein VGP70_01840 [Actinomadura sp.]|nr:hypothetical protein [Actinomadura sp.]
MATLKAMPMPRSSPSRRHHDPPSRRGRTRRFFSRPWWQGASGLLAVLGIVISILALDGNDEKKKEDRASGSPAGPTAAAIGASPPSSVPSSPVVPAPIVKVVVELNPLKMGSDTLSEIAGRNQDWLIPAGRPVKGSPERAGEQIQFYEFARARGGVSLNRVFISATVQSLTEGAVYLRNMRLSELNCPAPVKGTRIWLGGGADPLQPRAVLIDLSAKRPRPWYFPGGLPGTLEMPPGNPPKGQRPFGFGLKKDDSETFDVVATLSSRKSCQFKLVIDAVLSGESREITIDDAGKPFRVTGDPDFNYWMWNPYGPTEGEGLWSNPGEHSMGTRSPGEVLPETD